MSKIRLEPINDDNFYAVTKLKLAKEQKHFVASNSYSIIHAYLAMINGQKAYPFAILLEDKPVGFIMVGFDILSEKVKDNPKCNWFICNNYIIWRLMIDKKYQGKGYAKEAMKLALDFVRTFPCGKAKYCWLSYEIENDVARNLYKSFGFKEVPDAYKEGGEMPAILEL
jgi:diamine N-acetyltransferase